MHLSLDGYASTLAGEFDWVAYDEGIAEDVQEFILSRVDTAIYGPKTYQGMYGYWPTVLNNPDASEDELRHANWVENAQKIVFSTTLDKAEWNNTRLIKEDLAGEVRKLKAGPGKDMMIFGSPLLVHSFAKEDLIDEYRLSISPVVLGSGVPMFAPGSERVNLKLLESKTFNSGLIAVHYEVVH